MKDQLELRLERIDYYLEFSNAILPKLDPRARNLTRQLIRIIEKQRDKIDEKRYDFSKSLMSKEERIAKTIMEDQAELVYVRNLVSQGMAEGLAYALAQERELGAFLELEILRKNYKIPDSFPREYERKLRFICQEST